MQNKSDRSPKFIPVFSKFLTAIKARPETEDETRSKWVLETCMKEITRFTLKEISNYVDFVVAFFNPAQ